ncbi:MAG: type VII secretion integral membrane protein EccD [Micromonosporaceae bacterium]|nr:type VII secretion integral membrane protein EccD [Micromonosporaceae bacterium]
MIVISSDRRVELAVPSDVPIADLLPSLLGHLGPSLADTGLDHEGWVLQRLGEPPLEEDLDATALDLRDGETLYLRPRSDQIPPPDFDDLIDGVAGGMRERAGIWRPEMTRWAGRLFLILVLITGMVVIAVPGPTPNRATVAAVLTLLAFLGAGLAGRLGGDRPLAVVLAFGAVGYAALAGLLAPGADLPEGPGASPAGLLDGLDAVNAICAVGAALTVALLAVSLVGRAGPILAALLAAALAALPGLLVAIGWSISTVSAAGLVAVVSGVLTLTVPRTAFRLSGMRLAPLPTSSDQLQDDIEPEQSVRVLERAAAADRYMTGMYLGLAAASSTAVIVLALHSGWAPPTLATLVVLAGVLAGRSMTSCWHRLAGTLPALVALPTLAATVGASLSDQTRMLTTVVVVPLAALAVVLVTLTLPVRRASPYWGRLGDITQTWATIGQIPVLLAAFGVYDVARALGG